MIPRIRKLFDFRYFVISLIVLATVGIAVAGYAAQAIQYDHLFSLYEKQNAQLRANGIKPTTPSPNQVAAQGVAGSDGAIGSRGPQGAPGVDGTNGVLGADGATGSAGATGAAGTNGTNGADGTPGTPGLTGPAGTAGAAGPAGPAGAMPQSLTFITPTGLVYICTPPTANVSTYTCTAQAPAVPAPAVLTAIG